MIENPKNTAEDYSSILGLTALRLAASYVDGYSSLKLLFELLNLQKNYPEIFLKYPEFYNHLWGICFQSVIINLSNILVWRQSDDSINIYALRSYFYDFIQHNQDFDCPLEICNAINAIIDKYSVSSNFYKGIKDLRHKYIAHIDKNRFFIGKGPEPKLPLQDIRDAYHEISNLVGLFMGQFGINPELIDFSMLQKANLEFRLLIGNPNKDVNLGNNNILLEYPD